MHGSLAASRPSRVGEWRFMVGFEFAVVKRGSADRCSPGVGTRRTGHRGSSGAVYHSIVQRDDSDFEFASLS